MLDKHYIGYQLKRGKEEVRGLHGDNNSDGHQPDECDVGWNLPNSNGQTGVESMECPMC